MIKQANSDNKIIQDQTIDKQKIRKAAASVVLNIAMNCKVKDLVKENVMMQNLDNLNNVPLHSYILKGEKQSRLKGLDYESVIQNTEDMLEDLKANSDIPRIAKDCYFERLCDIFSVYFFVFRINKYVDNGIYDENGIPDYFPETIRKFIYAAYPVFEKIRDIKASYDLESLLTAENNEDTWIKTYLNRAKILTLALTGKIRSGRNITRLLFDGISGDTQIPESFKRLCRIKSGKYTIFNTDPKSIDFQLAVFDFIEFVDLDNKALFDAKIKQYLQA